MASHKTFSVAFFSIVFIFFTENGIAQARYVQSGDSYLAVSGTSTLNAWTMNSEEGKYQADFEVSENGLPIKLLSLSVTVPCESLKSGHSAMDKNAYSALGAHLHKSITFILVSSSTSPDKIECTGNLTVAGKTQLITLEAGLRPLGQKAFLVTGKKQLKMTDFGIEPPSFMFGTVTTGNEVTVSFNVKLIPAKG